MANTFRAVLVLSALSLGLPLVAAAELKAAPRRIAVVDIGFTDSSGESRNQLDEHATRQRVLTEGLYRQVAQPGRLESLHLDCGAGCSLDAAGVEALRQRAREAGAAYVLVGKVHKMSTLVMSMRFAVLDTASGKLVLERLLSFRGDNDEGWRHAGDYAAREVAGALP
ncbi:DUF2380 domain-containing protein [Ancylobacter sp. VNQ12]|uniref:DUF2380 domain-containing protein n=1 Tax=Ancylobacter sp. VNQ12 TaxID=3400920 RepID=UPI003C0E1455